MRFSDFMELMHKDPEAMYAQAIEEIAGTIIAMSILHHKSLDTIGDDLNKAVDKLKEAKDGPIL